MVQLTFTRRGGFVASTIEGKVDFVEHSASVSSSEHHYKRELSPSEIRQLTGIANPADLLALRAKLGPAANTAPDQYEFEITVKLSDGKEYTTRFPEQNRADLDKGLPGLGNLYDWISKECERIPDRKS